MLCDDARRLQCIAFPFTWYSTLQHLVIWVPAINLDLWLCNFPVQMLASITVHKCTKQHNCHYPSDFAVIIVDYSMALRTHSLPLFATTGKLVLSNRAPKFLFMRLFQKTFHSLGFVCWAVDHTEEFGTARQGFFLFSDGLELGQPQATPLHGTHPLWSRGFGADWSARMSLLWVCNYSRTNNCFGRFYGVKTRV